MTATTTELKAAYIRRHPLQRVESPSKGFSGVVHVLGLWCFYSGFKFLTDNPTIMNESFGWHLQYLTIIGLTICTLGFSAGLLADITSSRTLFNIKNYISLVAAPIEILISILYWGLRAINPKFVIPPDLPILPTIADWNFHLFPAVLLTLDALLLSPPWPSSPINPNASLIILTLSTIFAFAYWFWIEICYSRNGFYPYPIFDMLGTNARIGLFLFSGIVMWIASAALRAVYRLVNGLDEEIAEGKVKEG